MLKIVTEKDSAKPTVTNINPGPSSSSQVKVAKYFLGTKVTVFMTAEKFKGCTVEMVVKNSVPLTFFSTPAFVGLDRDMPH